MAERLFRNGQWVVTNTTLAQIAEVHSAFYFWLGERATDIHYYNDGSGHIFTGFMSGNDYEHVLHFEAGKPIAELWDDLATYIAKAEGLPIEPVPQPSEEDEASRRYEAMLTNFYSRFTVSKAQAFNTEFKQFITHPKFSVWRTEIVGEYWLNNKDSGSFAYNSGLVRQMLAEFRAVRIPEAQVQQLAKEVHERFLQTPDNITEAATFVLSRAAIEVEL